MSKHLVLADGRQLAYEDTGDPNGLPIFFQHGTGDSRLCKYPQDSVTAGLGVRLITTDRPGVGGSTIQPKRNLLGWAKDIEALADSLGIEQFVVAGHSGGGPHALAIAHVLGDRVNRIGLASPLAPFDEPGNKKLVKDKDLNMVFHLSHLKFLAQKAAKAEAHHYLKNIKGFVKHCADTYPADRHLFTDPILEPMFEAEFTEALQNDGQGALADFWAFLDWGFKLENIQQPVQLFYGDADTILDPASAKHFEKRLPNCTSQTWPGAGHYGLYSLDHWTMFLGSLKEDIHVRN